MIELRHQGVPARLAKQLATNSPSPQPIDMSLPGFLYYWFISPLTNKQFFGEEYLEYNILHTTLGWMSEAGATVSYNYAGDHKDLFELIMPGYDLEAGTVWGLLTELTANVLERYRSTFGADPASMTDLHKYDAYDLLGVDLVSDTRSVRKAASRKVGWRSAINHFPQAYSLFGSGVAYALNHRELFLGKINGGDGIKSQNPAFQVIGTELTPPAPSEYLRRCRLWARLCRPDLLHLFD